MSCSCRAPGAPEPKAAARSRIQSTCRPPLETVGRRILPFAFGSNHRPLLRREAHLRGAFPGFNPLNLSPDPRNYEVRARWKTQVEEARFALRPRVLGESGLVRNGILVPGDRFQSRTPIRQSKRGITSSTGRQGSFKHLNVAVSVKRDRALFMDA